MDKNPTGSNRGEQLEPKRLTLIYIYIGQFRNESQKKVAGSTQNLSNFSSINLHSHLFNVYFVFLPILNFDSIHNLVQKISFCFKQVLKTWEKILKLSNYLIGGFPQSEGKTNISKATQNSNFSNQHCSTRHIVQF